MKKSSSGKKNVKASKRLGTQTRDYPEEIKKMIAERAYYIWESKGRPENSAWEDWFQAEKELKEQGLIK